MDKNYNEFNLHLNVGQESLEITFPVANGMPNSATITLKSSSSRQVVTSTSNEPVKRQAIEDEPSMPIVPVDLSEETEDTLVHLPETLEQVFLTKYTTKAYLYNHMCNAIGKHVEFSDLTKPNLMKIKDYFISRVSTNTVSLYCSIIKACMNLYSDENVFKCKGYGQVLKYKRAPSMHVFLNEEEIKRIEQYVPRNRCESDVKVKFLIECYTGARLSDVENMTLSNVKDGNITYISKKTNVFTKVPAHKNLIQLLEAKNQKKMSRPLYGRTIKTICKNIGIDEETNIFYHGKQRTELKWKFICSHTARRSFATNLALRNVPIQVIGKMMGHKGDTKMTEKYIVANVESIDDRAMEFFK